MRSRHFSAEFTRLLYDRGYFWPDLASCVVTLIGFLAPYSLVKRTFLCVLRLFRLTKVPQFLADNLVGAQPP